MYISEAEYEKQMKQIQRENLGRQRANNLRAERKKYREPRKIPTSKLVLGAMVSLVFIVAIWFMYESHRLADLSQAYALLGIVASLVPVIWSYYSKSKAENTEGGIIYESAMREQDDIGRG